MNWPLSLQWLHNECDGISNHQPHDGFYSTVYSRADQRKHQSSASLAFARGIHWWPVNSPHKGPLTRKRFPFDDIIMLVHNFLHILKPFVWYRMVYISWSHAWSAGLKRSTLPLLGAVSSINTWSQWLRFLNCHQDLLLTQPWWHIRLKKLRSYSLFAVFKWPALHWNGNIIRLTNFSILAALEVVKNWFRVTFSSDVSTWFGVVIYGLDVALFCD